MTILAEMTRSETYYWLQEHAQKIGVARDAFEEAARAYAALVASCDGALERTGATAESYLTDIMDRADGALADELKRDLGL